MKCQPDLTYEADTVSLSPDNGGETGSEASDELGDVSQVMEEHAPSHAFK